MTPMDSYAIIYLQRMKQKKCVFKYLEKKRFIQYALDFEQTLRQLEEYLHISDDQEEIINGTLETACEFYQGDWCGFIEVDMDLG